MTPARPKSRRRAARRRRRGFSLVEVLATLLLVGVVLPAIMQGLTLATRVATTAKRRSEAAALAERQLSEIIALGQWQQSHQAGDFGPDWADYRWDATAQDWAEGAGGAGAAGVREVEVRVTWMQSGREDFVSVSTLAYEQQESSDTGASSSGSSSGSTTP